MGKKDYPLEVIRVDKALFGRTITVEATRKAEAVYDSFLGERCFYLKKGYTLRIRVKGTDWRRGDTLPMSTLVHYAWDWSDIPWRWE